MNSKKIMIWVLVAAGLLGLMWWGGRGQASPIPGQTGGQQKQSALVVDKSVYEFGTISMAQGLVRTVFKVTNPTNADIFVPSVTTSCMCTKAYIINGDQRKGPYGMPGHASVPKANETIKAGETRDIEVVYDPAAHGPAGVGFIDRFVFLQDEDGGVLTLEIKANVTP